MAMTASGTTTATSARAGRCARYDTTGSGAAASGRPARILQATGLVKAFGPAPSLNGASVGVDRGETLGVMGPSGSGKSKLLAAAARERGTTVIVVTHDARVAAYADREIVVSDGTVSMLTKAEG
jgi:ABC-type lipoprotein export system ATPase subunit